MDPATPEAAPPTTEKKPPNPSIVFLLSLFGYPGVGHFMVGARTLGVVFGVVFTGLTVGILYEMWVLVGPLLKLMTQGTPMSVSPNWPRIAFWVVSTSIVWVASGLHSYMLAKKLQ